MNDSSWLRVALVVAVVSVPLTISCKGQSPSKAPMPEQKQPKIEQAVLFYLKLSDDKFGESEEREAIFKLEDELEKKIASAKVGEYDGHEFGKGFATFYMYGPDADKLFDAVKDSIRKHKPRAGSYIIKRYGKPGDKEERVNL